MRLDLGVGDSGGHVFELETAVKDGILGGGGGGGGEGGKLDLNAMIEEVADSVEVPGVFICPISLEPMRDPVTLCTGQTYERSNILRWMSLGGRLTCPTTMQELWDHSLTPNRTLLHLTSTWFSQNYSAVKKKAQDVQGRAQELLQVLMKAKGQARVQVLKDLRHLVAAHAHVTSVVGPAGIALISSLLGPFTSYAVGSEAVEILVNLPLDSDSRKSLLQPPKVSLLVDLLNEGCIETKLNATKLIGSLIEIKGGSGLGLESGSEVVVCSLGLLAGLLRLVKDKRHPNGVLAGLGLLLTIISSQESVRKSIVGIGAVPQLVELLPGLDPQCLECALPALESLSTLPEGAAALKDCPNTMPNLTKLLMRVSQQCTKYVVSVLWAVCTLDPEACAPVAVEAGLAAKLLLVIQSGCDPLLKQRSAELLKLCSVNYSGTAFISKCKLTRTMR